MKKIKQHECFGCGVACIASLLNISYSKAKEITINYDPLRGLWCKDIVSTLKKQGLNYTFCHIKSLKKIPNNSIIFLKKSARHPDGHYILKTTKEYMNPWINFPKLNAKAAIQKRICGKPQYVVFPNQEYV